MAFKLTLSLLNNSLFLSLSSKNKIKLIMKKIVTLFLLPLLVFTFITCNKEEEKKEKTKLIKTVEMYSEQDTVSSTAYYEYGSKKDLLNIELNALSLFNFAKGLKLKGFSSKNYMIQTTGTEYLNGYSYPAQISTYSYEFDTEGYPTEITINENAGKIILTYY
jgi:hypothetical protein